MKRAISLYDMMDMEGESIFKSIFTMVDEEDSENVRIAIEPYDGTFSNTVVLKGTEYIWKRLEDFMGIKSNRDTVTSELELERFKGATVTLYGRGSVQGGKLDSEGKIISESFYN